MPTREPQKTLLGTVIEPPPPGNSSGMSVERWRWAVKMGTALAEESAMWSLQMRMQQWLRDGGQITKK